MVDGFTLGLLSRNPPATQYSYKYEKGSLLVSCMRILCRLMGRKTRCGRRGLVTSKGFPVHKFMVFPLGETAGDRQLEDNQNLFENISILHLFLPTFLLLNTKFRISTIARHNRHLPERQESYVSQHSACKPIPKPRWGPPVKWTQDRNCHSSASADKQKTAASTRESTFRTSKTDLFCSSTPKPTNGSPSWINIAKKSLPAQKKIAPSSRTKCLWRRTITRPHQPKVLHDAGIHPHQNTKPKPRIPVLGQSCSRAQ